MKQTTVSKFIVPGHDCQMRQPGSSLMRSLIVLSTSSQNQFCRFGTAEHVYKNLLLLPFQSRGTVFSCHLEWGLSGIGHVQTEC